jgi:hypothetical protein
LLYLDEAPNQAAMDSLRATDMFQTVNALQFDV